MKKAWDFGEYFVAGDPDKRKRAWAWATSIGLQDVDGLTVSDYLLQTAKRNIEGEITSDEAIRLIDEYYTTKAGEAEPADKKEADRVSARMNRLVALPGSTLSPVFYWGLHKQLFQDVFAHAGMMRTVELSKREWVLKGE